MPRARCAHDGCALYPQVGIMCLTHSTRRCVVCTRKARNTQVLCEVHTRELRRYKVAAAALYALSAAC